MNIIRDELNKLGVTCDSCTVLQEKDGITVARVARGEHSWVLKCFQKDEYKREIANYKLLNALGVPTIRVEACSDSALLLDDLATSAEWRLGMPEDMNDPEMARRLAAWYRQLHSRGYAYVCEHGASLYDENDCFMLDNIRFIREKTGNHPAWQLVERNVPAIQRLLGKVRRTLTYNDFYYTNLAVARDQSAALMFDYNLLGKGYAYADVRNVLSSLSGEAGKAFLEAYGAVDPREAALDDVLSPVVTLFMVCRRERFPEWAQPLLEDVENGFEMKIRILQKLL